MYAQGTGLQECDGKVDLGAAGIMGSIPFVSIEKFNAANLRVDNNTANWTVCPNCGRLVPPEESETEQTECLCKRVFSKAMQL